MTREWKRLPEQTAEIAGVLPYKRRTWIILSSSCIRVDSPDEVSSFPFPYGPIAAAGIMPDGNLFLYAQGRTYVLQANDGNVRQWNGMCTHTRDAHVMQFPQYIVAVSQYCHCGLGDVYACHTDSGTMYLYQDTLGERVVVGEKYAVYQSAPGILGVVHKERVCGVYALYTTDWSEVFVGNNVIGTMTYRDFGIVTPEEHVVFTNARGCVEIDGDRMAVLPFGQNKAFILDTKSGRYTSLDCPFIPENVAEIYLSPTILVALVGYDIWVAEAPLPQNGDWRSERPVGYVAKRVVGPLGCVGR